MNILQAIAHQEGFYENGSRASRNNNPGNIVFEPWTATKFGAVIETIPPGYREEPRFAHFPDEASGWSALEDLLYRKYSDMTIADAISRYAPVSENDTAAYIQEVTKLTGLYPSTTVEEALGEA